MSSRRSAVHALLALALLASCSSETEPPGVDGGPPADSASATCATAADCSDGVYCNGSERCDPDAEGADARGCVAAASPRCLSSQTCDEEADTCRSDCEAADDADGDGARSTDCGGDDCDDADERRFPGNVELCDAEGLDEDCDPTTLGPDADTDGFVSAMCCNLQDDGELLCGADCDDTNRETNPDAAEVCGPRDDDCDGRVDEGLSGAFFSDCDGDMYGSPTGEMVAGCRPPPIVPAICGSAPLAGWANNDDDCDDARGGRNPGNAEVCNGVDDDCDLMVDEGFTGEAFYPDCDGDGHGALSSETAAGCTAPPVVPTSCGAAPSARWARGATDCDDTRASVSPVAVEVCGNSRDDDCDTLVDEGGTPFYPDADGDGFGAEGGTPMIACSAPTGYSPNASDCDDTNATIRPGAQELCDGARDEDCDDAIDELPGAALGCGSVAGTTYGCAAGMCTVEACAGTRRDCDSSAATGCEADIATSTLHCGACGSACSLGLYCTGSACRPAHVWSRSVGGGGSDELYAVVAEGSDLVAAGVLAGTGNIGGGSITSTGTTDGLVASYGPTGTLLWSARIGGTGASASLRDVARDAAGNLYVAGTFTGMVSAGGGTLTSAGLGDAIVASFTSTGAHRWSRRFGGAGSDTGFALAADASGNLVAVLHVNGAVDLGGGPVGASGRNSAVLLALTSAGAYRWSRELAATASGVYPERIVLDASGASYVVGSFQTAVDFGGGVIANMGNDGFAASYDPSGNHRWSRRFGAASSDGLDAVALDGSGGMVAVGAFQGTVDFGTGPLVARGSSWSDLVVMRLDRASGVTTWARRFGDVEAEIAASIAVDASGNLLVGGMFDGDVDFGGGPMTSQGGNYLGSPFLLGLTSTGTYRFVRVPTGDGQLNGIAVSGGRALVVGGWGRNMDLGGGALPQYDSAGSSNMDGFAGAFDL